jgi:hypothetical protein
MGGFHMGFGANGGAAAEALSAVQRLREAASQQQKLQQQQIQQQFNDELNMRKAGYTPYLQTTGQQPSGLKTRDSQQVDPSRVITDPFGRKWVAPDTKPAATPQQTYSDTSSLFKEGALPVSPQGTVHTDTDIPRFSMSPTGPADASNLQSTGQSGLNVPVPDQSRVVTPPGSSQSFYRPTEGETLQEKLRAESRKQEITHPGADDIDTKSFNVPVHINKSTGKVTALDLPAGVTAAEKKEKPDAASIVPGLTGPNGGLIVFDKDKQTTTEVPVPKGSKRELTPAQLESKSRADQAVEDRKAAREERESAANDKVVETLQGKHEKISGEAQQYRELAEQYQSQIGVANGEKYIDPMDKSRIARPMSAETRTALGQGYMKAKTKADALDKQADTFAKQIESRQAKRAQPAAPRPRVQVGPVGGGATNMMQPTGAPPSGRNMMQPTGAPTGGQPMAAGGKKSTTLDKVRAYAKANNMSDFEAMQAAIAEGYSVTRPSQGR